VRFVSDKISSTILTDRWSDIVVNMHATTEHKCDAIESKFYERLEHVFDKFPKYHMKTC
jgi:hypothetical protein